VCPALFKLTDIASQVTTLSKGGRGAWPTGLNHMQERNQGGFYRTPYLSAGSINVHEFMWHASHTHFNEKGPPILWAGYAAWHVALSKLSCKDSACTHELSPHTNWARGLETTFADYRVGPGTAPCGIVHNNAEHWSTSTGEINNWHRQIWALIISRRWLKKCLARSKPCLLES
jgi:hypothetical protein